MIEILSIRYVCRHNEHYIDKLFRKFLSSDVDLSTKDQLIDTYLNNLEYEFDLSEKSTTLIYKLCIDSGVITKMKLYFVLENLFSPHQNRIINDFNMIFDTLINNKNLIIVQYALARLVIEKRINYYSYDQVVTILKQMYDIFDNNEIDNHPLLNKFMKININAILESLASLRLKNLTNIISDSFICDLLNKHKCQRTVNLLELFYLLKRTTSYTILTLANNTNIDLKYQVRLSSEKTEEFILGKHKRKIYEKLRDQNITSIELKILSVNNNELLIHHSYVDINAYVSIYGLNKFKFAIYYEPDASLDSRTPNSAMINDVADILKQEYLNQKKEYPSLTYDFFIKNLGCDEVGTSQHHNNFVRKLNNTMRPLQLENAIKIILEGF